MVRQLPFFRGMIVAIPWPMLLPAESVLDV
jgi:hypothetical protein